jgi:hypothetical protein
MDAWVTHAIAWLERHVIWDREELYTRIPAARMRLSRRQALLDILSLAHADRRLRIRMLRALPNFPAARPEPSQVVASKVKEG